MRPSHARYSCSRVVFNAPATLQREADEGRSKNTSEGKKRVAENESSARTAEAAYRADAHVNVSCFIPRDSTVFGTLFINSIACCCGRFYDSMLYAAFC